MVRQKYCIQITFVCRKDYLLLSTTIDVWWRTSIRNIYNEHSRIMNEFYWKHCAHLLECRYSSIIEAKLWRIKINKKKIRDRAHSFDRWSNEQCFQRCGFRGANASQVVSWSFFFSHYCRTLSRMAAIAAFLRPFFTLGNSPK